MCNRNMILEKKSKVLQQNLSSTVSKYFVYPDVFMGIVYQVSDVAHGGLLFLIVTHW